MHALPHAGGQRGWHAENQVSGKVGEVTETRSKIIYPETGGPELGLLNTPGTLASGPFHMLCAQLSKPFPRDT